MCCCKWEQALLQSGSHHLLQCRWSTGPALFPSWPDTSLEENFLACIHASINSSAHRFQIFLELPVLKTRLIIILYHNSSRISTISLKRKWYAWLISVWDLQYFHTEAFLIRIFVLIVDCLQLSWIECIPPCMFSSQHREILRAHRHRTVIQARQR